MGFINRLQQKFKTKGGPTYVVLLLAFLFSLLININFVSERAVSSLTLLQESNSKLQAQSTFFNIDQFVENRVKLIEELATSSMVISSVMGVDVASANLADLLNDFKVLGSKENIYITDFTGELIYSQGASTFVRPILLNKIIEQQAPLVVQLIKKADQHYFSISMPVKFNNEVEGMITFDVVSRSIENLLAELIKNNNYAVSLIDQDNLIFQTVALEDFSLLEKNPIANTPMVLNFYTSLTRLKEEKEQYIWQIGSTITLTTLFAFILLVLLIRSLLINPLEKLAISERKTKQSEERYQLAIDGSNDGIWDWNVIKNVIYLSPRLSSMMGGSKGQKLAVVKTEHLFLDGIHPNDENTVKQAIEAHITDNTPLDFDFRMKGLNEHYRYFRIRGATQRDGNGNALRMAGSMSDITELKEQSLTLEKALEEAKGANIAKSDFLANMSHEIRTPMNGVLGSLQLLQRDNLSSDSSELVEMAIRSSESLLTIINDILDLSKIESNNISLELLPTNMFDLLNAIIAEVSLSAKEKGIGLVLTMQESLHPHRLTDHVRLRQIIVNLISNAIKFTAKGEVRVSLGEKNDMLVLEVKDTGIGLSQDQIDKLFNRFEQADATTTRKFGGTGLGLCIAKQLANLMGGDIKVTSQENIGSMFSVLLPLKKTAIKNDHIEGVSKIKAPQVATLDILLAEDNKINQKIFNAIVRPTQASIRIANDGIEAIEAAKIKLPDIVFMDIQMPNMDGIKACEILKSSYPDVFIVALTANVMAHDIKKYKQVGFDHCLGKPVDVNEIYTLLQGYVTAS